MFKNTSQNIEQRLAKVREKLASEGNPYNSHLHNEESLPSDLELGVGGWDNWGNFNQWDQWNDFTNWPGYYEPQK